MSPKLRKYSTDRSDDLRRRINKLRARVYMAMHKYLDKPLPKFLQDSPSAISSCPPLAYDITRRLETVTPPSSYTTPTSPQQTTTTTHKVLYPAPYRPYSPPFHPPPDIPLPPIPLSISSFPAPPSRLPTFRLPERPDTATCIDTGHLAADIIEALPRGYRRIALLVFDSRHPQNDGRMAAQSPPPPLYHKPLHHQRGLLLLQFIKSTAMRKRRRRDRQELAVVYEEDEEREKL